MMQTKITEPVTLERTIERDIYEHEVLLSFNNDSGAISFHEWWVDKGQIAFEKWLQEEES